MRSLNGQRSEEPLHDRLPGHAQSAVHPQLGIDSSVWPVSTGFQASSGWDHGSPFASVGLSCLSRLSIWWIEQGIVVEFTRPGKPQDNGSHERMHKDLKAEATKPPSTNMRAQQRRFQRWVHTYNYERPHETLGMLRPAEVYHPSKKRMGEKVKMRYPKNYLVRTISISGFFLLKETTTTWVNTLPVAVWAYMNRTMAPSKIPRHTEP